MKYVLGVGVLPQTSVEDRIRDLVTDLVRVTFTATKRVESFGKGREGGMISQTCLVCDKVFQFLTYTDSEVKRKWPSREKSMIG